MECRLKDLTIYYEIHGSGKPIIMIHGFMPDHRLMKGCMEPVFNNRKKWKRIYFDLPGMGKTKGESWIQSSDQMLEIILEFIDTVIPNQTFLLAGESYGGYLARGVIHKKIELIDGLLLICPLIIPQANNRVLPENVTLVRDDNLISRLSEGDRREFESISVVQSQRIWERFRDEILPALEIADEPFLSKLQKRGYSFSFNLDSLTVTFKKPTLFVMGRQDSIVGYRDAWNIIENYPRSSFAVLDKAGHNLQIEQEGLFSELVSEWLDRVENNTF